MILLAVKYFEVLGAWFDIIWIAIHIYVWISGKEKSFFTILKVILLFINITIYFTIIYDILHTIIQKYGYLYIQIFWDLGSEWSLCLTLVSLSYVSSFFDMFPKFLLSQDILDSSAMFPNTKNWSGFPSGFDFIYWIKNTF